MTKAHKHGTLVALLSVSFFLYLLPADKNVKSSGRKKKRHRKRPDLDFDTSDIIARDTTLSPKGHNPNPSQTLLLTRDKVLKHMSILRPFSANPPYMPGLKY